MRPYVVHVTEARQKIFYPYEISHLVGEFMFTKYIVKSNGWGMGDNLLCTDYLKHPVFMSASEGWPILEVLSNLVG